MSVDFTINNLSSRTSVRARSAAPAFRASAAAPAQNAAQQSDLFAARQTLLALYERVQALAEAADVRLGSASRFSGVSAVQSSAPLGLDLTTSAAALRSTEALNNVSLGYDSSPSAWSGATSTALTIFGSYDGSQGTDTLTFSAQSTGFRILSDLSVRVSDGLNNTLATVTVRSSDPVGTRYAIGNGLEFSLGTGQMIAGNTATLGVYDNLDNTIYSDQPFNGSGTSGTNFDPNNDPIVNGSFTINGETISVAADDTLDAVLARINTSAAGVTAAFNSETERVELTQNTAGSAGDIIIAGDDSNLVAALRLTDAVLESGRDSDADVRLDALTQFSGVSSGDVSVNSNAVAIDPASDTLNTVISKLNDADTGVDVSFSELTQRASFAPVDSSVAFSLDEGATGLLSALNITPGLFEPSAEQVDGISKRRSYAFADALEQTLESINTLFDDGAFGAGSQFVSAARSPLNSALSDLVSEAYGLSGLSRSEATGDTVALDRRRLTRNLQRNGSATLALFRGRNGAGLVERLERATINALQSVSAQLGIESGIVDQRA